MCLDCTTRNGGDIERANLAGRRFRNAAERPIDYPRWFYGGTDRGRVGADTDRRDHRERDPEPDQARWHPSQAYPRIEEDPPPEVLRAGGRSSERVASRASGLEGCARRGERAESRSRPALDAALLSPLVRESEGAGLRVDPHRAHGSPPLTPSSNTVVLPADPGSQNVSFGRIVAFRSSATLGEADATGAISKSTATRDHGRQRQHLFVVQDVRAKARAHARGGIREREPFAEGRRRSRPCHRGYRPPGG